MSDSEPRRKQNNSSFKRFNTILIFPLILKILTKVRLKMIKNIRLWKNGVASSRVMDCSRIPLEEEVARIAASDLARQLMEEGVTVDNLIRNEIESQMRNNVSNLIAAPHSKRLSKKNLVKEALGLSNIVSLKLQTRKKILQKKSEILSTKQKWYIVRPSDFKKLVVI